MAEIYPKYDAMLNRDLHSRERFKPQLAQIEQMHKMLESLTNRLNNASDRLTEEEMNLVADAVQNAFNAVSNAAELGMSNYYALPVRVVRCEEIYNTVSKTGKSC